MAVPNQVGRFSRLPAVLTDGDGERNKEMDRHNVDITMWPSLVGGFNHFLFSIIYGIYNPSH